MNIISWKASSLLFAYSFNRIDIPPYESYEKLYEKLLTAIEETCGFAVEWLFADLRGTLFILQAENPFLSHDTINAWNIGNPPSPFLLEDNMRERTIFGILQEKCSVAAAKK